MLLLLLMMALMVMQECVSLEKDRDGCPKIVNLGRCSPHLNNSFSNANHSPKPLQKSLPNPP